MKCVHIAYSRLAKTFLWVALLFSTTFTDSQLLFLSQPFWLHFLGEEALVPHSENPLAAGDGVRSPNGDLACCWHCCSSHHSGHTHLYGKEGKEMMTLRTRLQGPHLSGMGKAQSRLCHLLAGPLAMFCSASRF